VPEPGKFKSLVVLYRASADYQKLAPSTKTTWSPWLDRIADYFGGLSIAAFDHPKIRQIIRQWRNRYAATPRTADMALQVLSRVCSHAVDPLGRLASNPCEGIKALYANDRAAIIWTEVDIAKIKQHCTPEIAHAVDLAAASGLRLGDLLRLSWSHIQDDAIGIATGKSRGRREAIVPLYDGLREVLARIPKRSTTVLTNKSGRPWSSNVNFSTTFGRARDVAGLDGLHYHDLRGTAATRFYPAGLSMRVIAEIMGWTEASVENIIRKYVDRAAATKAVIRLLDKRPE
jgi:integrase